MISNKPKPSWKRGASLVEAVLAVGVLAVAIPLVFGAIAEAGRSGGDTLTDSRSRTILAECIAAVDRARAEVPGWFDPSPPGSVFPPDGDVWALAFADDGRVIGRVSKPDYDKGLREVDGEKVRYIATVTAEVSNNPSATDQPQGAVSQASPLRLTISLEHPATAPSDRRKVVEFHSLIR